MPGKVSLTLKSLAELRAQQSREQRSQSTKFEPAVACPEGLDGDALFRWAMHGVKPICCGKPVPRKTRVLVKPADNPSVESMLGHQWWLASSVEKGHIEAAGSVSRMTFRKLRRGEYSVRADCDLHGLTQAEARQVVTEFLEQAARKRLGCVRIIHGKGNNSSGQIPVLKNRLQQWLCSRRLSRYVLAYSSARPCDGGTGAIYVLLRQPR